MAVVVMAIVAERWLDQVVLYGAAAEPAGDIADQYTLPATLGDVGLIEAEFNVSGIATAIASPTLRGVRMAVTNVAGSLLDIIGAESWIPVSSGKYAAYFSPDPIVLIRQGERLLVQHLDEDSSGAPTIVGELLLKVVRIKAVEVPSAPIQLVR